MENTPLSVLFSGNIRLYIQLFQSLTVIITAAFILTQTAITRVLFNLEESIKKQVLLGLFFGLISMIGTYLGVYTDGAIANVRDIGAITGGLYGGPVVGIIAGIIGGTHRASLGGFTANSCALATILNGLGAGLLYKMKHRQHFLPLAGFFVGVIGESFHMILVLLIAKPYEQAFTLVSHVSGPMILVNSVGVMLFLLLIQVALKEKELVSALTAETVLKITEKTLPILSKGLTPETADTTAKIILKHTNLDAVGLTDTEKILAFRGAGEDHHKSLGEFKTESTRRAIKTGEIILMRDKYDISCINKNCPLESGVVVPMKTREGEIFGVLKLYRKQLDAITPLDLEIAKGLSTILATQIQLNKIEEEKKLRIISQLKALQAHINPHFLFNSLNTINFVVRTDPDKGRILIQKLSYILRETIYRSSNLVELIDEIRLVKSYLEIEKERFGNRLEYEINVEDKLYDFKVPSFIFQPIVENCVKHGFSLEKNSIKVTISAYSKMNRVFLEVEDTGKGMDKETIKKLYSLSENGSIGVKNVYDRLKNLYDRDFSFKVRSSINKGTKINIILPTEGVKEWLLEQLSLMTKSPQEKN